MAIHAKLMSELACVDRVLANLHDPLSRATLEQYARDLRSSLRANQAAVNALQQLSDVGPCDWDIAA